MNHQKLKYMKKILIIPALCILMFACNSKKEEGTNDEKKLEEVIEENQAKEVHGDLIKPEDVTLSTPLDQAMVKEGQAIYDTKCSACHKLTDEKLVGPGWAGVTKRREPAWIMNMVTNVDIMLESDPEAQKLLEQCLVRMPNQNMNKEDARKVLEFMRHNDGEK
jgi:mono/diheme cytochrome c family protein